MVNRDEQQNRTTHQDGDRDRGEGDLGRSFLRSDRTSRFVVNDPTGVVIPVGYGMGGGRSSSRSFVKQFGVGGREVTGPRPI